MDVLTAAAMSGRSVSMPLAQMVCSHSSTWVECSVPLAAIALAAA